jgi:hypothetical protein
MELTLGQQGPGQPRFLKKLVHFQLVTRKTVPGGSLERGAFSARRQDLPLIPGASPKGGALIASRRYGLY